MARIPTRFTQTSLIKSKDEKEILKALDCEDAEISFIARDKEGYIYCIVLKNRDYISNSHNERPYRYHYNPAPWNWM